MAAINKCCVAAMINKLQKYILFILSSVLPSHILCFLLWVAYTDNRCKGSLISSKGSGLVPNCLKYFIPTLSTSFFNDGSLCKQICFSAGLVHPTPPPFHAFPLDKEWREGGRGTERERERETKVHIKRKKRIDQRLRKRETVKERYREK